MRTNKMSRIYLGRHVYGFAAVTFGILTFVWRDLNAWRQIIPLSKLTHPEILLYVVAAIELFGGVAIQWAPTRRIGAFSLGTIYFIFALLAAPEIMQSLSSITVGAIFLSNSLWSRERWFFWGRLARTTVKQHQSWRASGTFPLESALFPLHSNNWLISQ